MINLSASGFSHLPQLAFLSGPLCFLKATFPKPAMWLLVVFLLLDSATTLWTLYANHLPTCYFLRTIDYADQVLCLASSPFGAIDRQSGTHSDPLLILIIDRAPLAT